MTAAFLRSPSCSSSPRRRVRWTPDAIRTSKRTVSSASGGRWCALRARGLPRAGQGDRACRAQGTARRLRGLDAPARRAARAPGAVRAARLVRRMVRPSRRRAPTFRAAAGHGRLFAPRGVERCSSCGRDDAPGPTGLDISTVVQRKAVRVCLLVRAAQREYLYSLSQIREPPAAEPGGERARAAGRGGRPTRRGCSPRPRCAGAGTVDFSRSQNDDCSAAADTRG